MRFFLTSFDPSKNRNIRQKGEVVPSASDTMWMYERMEVYRLVLGKKSVNTSRMDIKRKKRDIRNWREKHVFLNISSTNIDIHVPSLYHCVRNTHHTWLSTVVSTTPASPFQPLRHQRNVCHPVVNRFTRQTLPTVNRKHLFMNILCIQSFCKQIKAQQNAALRQYNQAQSTFWLLKPASEHEHARMLPRLS
jgi:hypothetical protein